MKTVILQLVLLSAAALRAAALPVSSVESAQALANDPVCPREDQATCLASNVNARCVSGQFQNDIASSCSSCYCTGSCSGKCA